METVKVGYERLFNLGNFDHEKFTITKDVAAGTEYKAMQKLSVTVADLEEDLKKYREICNKIESINRHLLWANRPNEESDKLKVERDDLLKQEIAFRTKHKPLWKACKCYYCTHDQYDDRPEEE